MFYYAFAIALGRLNNAYNTIESVSYALAEGRFDTVFLKPISLPFQKFGEFIGQSLLYWIPIIGLIFSRISLADNQIRVTQLFSIIVILFFSQILCFLLGFLLSLIAFWLERGEFILTLLSTAAAFFGGTLLPPGHWPVWIKPIMLYNPFRYMVAGPAEILSSLNFSQVETIFFGLGVYCLIFFGFTSMIWKIAQKKYSSVGG